MSQQSPSQQLADIDAIETQEWVDALAAVIEQEGVERAHREGAEADLLVLVFDGAREVEADLFVSLGDAEDNEMQSGFEALEAMLGSWSAPDLRWRAAITEGANHGTNPGLSFPVAAQWYAHQPRRP